MRKHWSIAVVMCILAIIGLTACGGTRQEPQMQQADATMPPQTAEATAPLLYEEDAAPADIPDIGREQIIAIVLERVPGATEADVYELESEYDDGRLEYEGSIYYGGYEYEFEIDGSTGNILQWEIDD